MERLIKFIKSIKLKQILTVFLAGSLLVISTACNKDNIAQAKGKEYTETSQRAMSDTSDKDKMGEQSFQGGMNKYNDDPRYDSGTAAGKTKTLIDTAERRKADDLGEYGDNVLERSVFNKDVDEKALKGFSRKLEYNKDKAADYVDDKSDKLKNNLERVPGESKRVFDEAVDNAKGAIDDRVVLPE
ncbi:MAG TPA: DUF6658 family protein [Coleofasciculaceae cyanobacterium]|jgi:hypothetical protein